ncbi:MAG TPA: phosphatidylserine decarboxylase family protein [Pyrinomonadaceae bacterium]|nr:phosphatidylserine decarboxylase family protein [Pyrinomonadaceae bacterium]
MAREGIPFVLIGLFIAIAFIFAGIWWLAIVFIALAAFTAYFFRDPEREITSEENLVVSAADGRVTRIEKLNPENADSPNVVSVFLSIFDVHINRSPIAGEIAEVVYSKGKFVIATREDASQINEQNALTIKNERMTIVCKQIAGVLARRIVCWKRAGDRVVLGERFGLIRFGSRTDLILPPEVEIAVKVGDRVRGGVTIIGRLQP